MNFNYSYRAFLITSLLFGIVALLFINVKMRSDIPVLQESYDVAYMEEAALVEEKKEIDIRPQEIETHKAYNEAEEFIKELESSRAKSESFDEQVNAMDKALQAADTYKISTASQKNNRSTTNDAGSNEETQNSTNRNSTNSFRLVDRRSLYFPNPVYICDSYGKVVINITVNDQGEVVNTSFSSRRSTTTNACLIDVALEYAQNSKFTTKAGKLEQLGTITYNFPGQD